MTITTGTILRVVAQLLWEDGEVAQNVFNVVISGGGGPWDEQDVLDDCLDWVEDMYANLSVLTAAELDGNIITVYKWDPIDTDWDEVGVNSWVYAGGGTAATGLPRGVAALITAKSVDPDSDARKYLPGMTEGSLVSEIFDATLITAMLLFGADWVTVFVGAASGASFQPSVWSVKDEIAKSLVSTLIASSVPAYQRRRKNNVGI